MHISERRQNFVCLVKTLLRPNSQGLHSSGLDGFDARISIFNSHAIWSGYLYQSRCIDEKVRRRFAIHYTITICYPIQVAHNIKELKYRAAVFAAGSDS